MGQPVNLTTFNLNVNSAVSRSSAHHEGATESHEPSNKTSSKSEGLPS